MDCPKYRVVSGDILSSGHGPASRLSVDEVYSSRQSAKPCRAAVWLSVHEDPAAYTGALDGGSQYRMSILRNSIVACLCHLFSPMSHVEFPK